MQRMDSTQIASNIVSASRLQLLVEGSPAGRTHPERSGPGAPGRNLRALHQDSAGHYTYRVKGKEAIQAHLQQIGQTIYTLLRELTRLRRRKRLPGTGTHLCRELSCARKRLRPKANNEIRSGCLQSVDDLEATYRTKGTGHYKGYVANLTETCDPSNELQLITKVQVAPNNVDDSQLLAEALPNLKERTDVETMITDGGYGGEASDQALQEAKTVTLIQTAIRGAQTDPNQFSLSDFSFQQDERGHPTALTCPQGQTVPVTPGRTTGWQARFDPAICSTCPFQLDGHCRTQPQKRDPRYLLTFTTKQIRTAQRRKAYLVAYRGISHQNSPKGKLFLIDAVLQHIL